MELETLVVPKAEARQKWQEYLRAEQTRINRQLKDVYYRVSKGYRIVDIFETLKKLPLNRNGEPAIAIGPSDASLCRIDLDNDGSAVYYPEHRDKWNSSRKTIRVPAKTFPENPKAGRIQLQTQTPLIPPNIAKKYPLGYPYFIIWEVEKWDQVPKDPILARRITSNLFAVMATWNLTEIERAVIRGHF